MINDTTKTSSLIKQSTNILAQPTCLGLVIESLKKVIKVSEDLVEKVQ